MAWDRQIALLLTVLTVVVGVYEIFGHFSAIGKYLITFGGFTCFGMNCALTSDNYTVN